MTVFFKRFALVAFLSALLAGCGGDEKKATGASGDKVDPGVPSKTGGSSGGPPSAPPLPPPPPLPGK